MKIYVRRAFASSLLSLLLLTTILWGGCISCEQFFMLPGAKTCCAPSGHCKTKLPTSQKSGSDCKQIAFEHQKSVDFHFDLPVIATISFDAPVRFSQLVTEWPCVNTAEPSPPDLQILNSTFLI
jgi:hypothetical protein